MMKRSALLLMLAALLISSQAIAQITVTKGSAASLVFKPRAVAATGLSWHFKLEPPEIVDAASAYPQADFDAVTWTGMGVVKHDGGVSTFTGVLYPRDCLVEGGRAGFVDATTSTPTTSTCTPFPAVSYSNCTAVFDDPTWGKGIGPCVYYFGIGNKLAPKYGYLEVRKLSVKNVYAGP